LKSITYFSHPSSKNLRAELEKIFEVNGFNKDPIVMDIDVHLPPASVCIVDDAFSEIDGIQFAAVLQKKYPKIVVVLCVDGEINNEIVKEAVSTARVYRIFSTTWNGLRIQRTIEDAFAYSKEIRRNQFLLKEEKARHQRLTSNQMALKNEEYLKVESLMYADQIVRYAKSSIESYNQILSAIGSGKKSDELLASIRKKISRLVPVDAISLCFRSKRISSSKKLNISLSFTNEAQKEEELNELARICYERMVEKMQPDSRNKVTKYLEEHPKSGHSCEIVNDLIVNSSLIIPLIHQEKYMGNLVLSRFREYKFKKREQLIVEHFSEAGNIVVRGFRNFEYFEKTKQEWESTFDAISDPVAIVDLDYTLIRVNKAYVHSSKFSIDSVVGEKCYKVFAGATEPCPRCPKKAAILEREVTSSDELNISDRVYNTWSYPVVSSNKELKSVVMYYRDISQESLLRKQLMEADKKAEIGILAGSVAHEINNPLGGILAFSQVLLKELKAEKQDKSQFYKDIQEIDTAGQRCKKIVEELLNFSRLSKIDEFMNIEVANVIKTVISLVDYNASLSNIEFNIDYESGVPQIYGNYNQIIQVFLSVLSKNINEIENEKNLQKREIAISVTHDKRADRLVVKIVNHGRKITGKKLAKIFNPEFDSEENREISTGSMVDRKVGLGLAVSYKIIQDHNGSIQVSSNKQGGNEYLISFPVSKGDNESNRKNFTLPRNFGIHKD
jgi:two-component system NtrC family sensor kinase